MRRLLSTVLVGALVFGHPLGALAATQSATSILTDRAALDGTVVSLEGEAIGEMLRADPGAVWVNVLSDGTALGVYVPTTDAGAVTVFGDYTHTGDIVRVTGVFNRACDQHGGDMDIHATQIEVVTPGSPREREVAIWKLGLAAAGFALAGASAYQSRRRRREGV